jgi:hypothetical protein
MYLWVMKTTYIYPNWVASLTWQKPQKLRPEWTTTHQHTMQDGWYEDRETWLYSCPITNHGG